MAERDERVRRDLDHARLMLEAALRRQWEAEANTREAMRQFHKAVDAAHAGPEPVPETA